MSSSSYLLERDILGSGRMMIDANSNGPLIQTSSTHLTYRSSYGASSPLPYPTTSNGYHHHGYGNGFMDSSDTKKSLADLQDQLRMLRKDLESKDALIKELTSLKAQTNGEPVDGVRYDSIIAHERAATETARRDLDQCRMKLETVSYELREASVKIGAKDERINELKSEIENLRKEFEAVSHLSQQLKIRVRELESNVGSYDSIANKSSITIAALQKDANEKQEQIIELQSRLRTHMMEREGSEQRSESLLKKFQDLFMHLSSTLGADLGQPSVTAFDTVVAKISELNADNLAVKGKMARLEEANKALDTENQANRATIQHMANQLHLYEQNSVNHLLQIDSIKAERDVALNEKTAAEKELETLKARLDTIQKAWQNTRGELDQRENKYSASESHLKQIENELLYAKSALESFKVQVAQLLSDGYVKVEPKEDEIRDKIQLLMQSSKDRGVIITNLQNQKEQLSKQLQEQIDLNKDLESKRRDAEGQLHDLGHRVKSLDHDYATNEAYRETLKQDKTKFLHFLQRLAVVLKIENISTDYAHELSPDVILTRAEQLMKLEKDAIGDQKALIANLQRKNQQLKEQMDNKDLHLDLLRKKVVALEEGRSMKTDLEREIDDHVMLARKMKVKVDHLTQQVTDLRHENIQLKAQITDIQTLKNRIAEQEKEIRRLLEEVNRLEGVRDKQAVKISTLQDKIHTVDEEAHRTIRSSDSTVRALSNEVRYLKSSLEQVTDRERRLLDFRALIARMLGLDSKALAIPDYEITARLEHILSVVPGAVAVPVVPVVPTTTTTTTTNHQHRHRSPSPRTHRRRSHSPLHVSLDPHAY